MDPAADASSERFYWSKTEIYLKIPRCPCRVHRHVFAWPAQDLTPDLGNYPNLSRFIRLFTFAMGDLYYFFPTLWGYFENLHFYLGVMYNQFNGYRVFNLFTDPISALQFHLHLQKRNLYIPTNNGQPDEDTKQCLLGMQFPKKWLQEKFDLFHQTNHRHGFGQFSRHGLNGSLASHELSFKVDSIVADSAFFMMCNFNCSQLNTYIQKLQAKGVFWSHSVLISTLEEKICGQIAHSIQDYHGGFNFMNRIIDNMKFEEAQTPSTTRTSAARSERLAILYNTLRHYGYATDMFKHKFMAKCDENKKLREKSVLLEDAQQLPDHKRFKSADLSESLSSSTSGDDDMSLTSEWTTVHV